MIVVYTPTENRLKAEDITAGNKQLLADAIWIDLLSPSKKEEKLVEAFLQVDIPTQKEMKEIEPSSRLYKDMNNLFMTATMVAQSFSSEPKVDQITFILTEKKLITVRYIEPRSLKSFIAKLPRLEATELAPNKLLIGLFEASIDRLADILEKVSHEFDEISQKIFRQKLEEPVNYKETLQRIGANADLSTKVRESLGSFSRIFSFLEQSTNNMDPDMALRLKIVNKDANALSDYTNFIMSKVNVLLDATLGMVNIEQNNIIKIFSVAAVMFLPPTLVASIYGMNFKHIPELNWLLGYPMALALIAISAWLPYRYFKKKKWL